MVASRAGHVTHPRSSRDKEQVGTDGRGDEGEGGEVCTLCIKLIPSILHPVADALSSNGLPPLCDVPSAGAKD